MNASHVRKVLLPVLAGGMALCLALPDVGRAAAVYPIDRASMLAGALFDFKVEFDAGVPESDISLTVNGADYTRVLKGKARYIADEEGKGSAIIMRGVSLPAGDYTVTAKAGDEEKTVTWKVSATGERKAKNVILLVADGLSVGHRTAARLLSAGMTEGKYNGRLAMDTMPHMAFVGTGSVDAITADSANTMSAYTTGHKSSINALGVYADRTADPFDDPKQETLAEILRRKTGMAIGIVSDAELEDATPAANVAHTRRRDEKAAIVAMLHDVSPDVLLGGGAAYFLPRSVPGSKRKDDVNWLETFRADGYTVVTSNTELQAVPADTRKLLGLFHPGNMDGVLDRRFLKKGTVDKFPDQPDLTDMAATALNILSGNPEGFSWWSKRGWWTNIPIPWTGNAPSTTPSCSTRWWGWPATSAPKTPTPCSSSPATTPIPSAWRARWTTVCPARTCVKKWACTPRRVIPCTRIRTATVTPTM